jgi:PHD/YefM family antitoxin component YafN of YafNO toxin-antitoxin module
MQAVKTDVLRKEFKRISNIATAGEAVLITRPHNDNVVLISEREYRRLQGLPIYDAELHDLSTAQQSSLTKIWDDEAEDEAWADL